MKEMLEIKLRKNRSTSSSSPSSMSVSASSSLSQSSSVSNSRDKEDYQYQLSPPTPQICSNNNYSPSNMNIISGSNCASTKVEVEDMDFIDDLDSEISDETDFDLTGSDQDLESQNLSEVNRRNNKTTGATDIHWTERKKKSTSRNGKKLSSSSLLNLSAIGVNSKTASGGHGGGKNTSFNTSIGNIIGGSRLQRKMFASNREQNASGAFAQLRRLVPTYPADRKISKSEILRLTIRYIRLLSSILEWQDSSTVTNTNNNVSTTTNLNVQHNLNRFGQGHHTVQTHINPYYNPNAPNYDQKIPTRFTSTSSSASGGYNTSPSSSSLSLCSAAERNQKQKNRSPPQKYEQGFASSFKIKEEINSFPCDFSTPNSSPQSSEVSQAFHLPLSQSGSGSASCQGQSRSHNNHINQSGSNFV